MDKSFLAECAQHRPELFQAMLAFNAKSFCPTPPKNFFLEDEALAQALWQDKNLRLAALPNPVPGGWWDFEQENRRYALLGKETLTDLCRHFSAAALGEKIARVIARDEQLKLRAYLGEDLFRYTLARGRYQAGKAGAILSGQCRGADLTGQFSSLAHAVLCLICEDWPQPLIAMLGLSLREEGTQTQDGEKKPSGAPHALSMAQKTGAAVHNSPIAPALTPQDRRAFDFTLKKILLREVAPQWEPCFD